MKATSPFLRTKILVIGMGLLATLLVAGSLAYFPLDRSNPAVFLLGGIFLLLAFLYPALGVWLLVITLWLDEFFRFDSLLTLNRVLGLVILAGMLLQKRFGVNRKPLVFGRFDFFFLAFLATAMISVLVNGSAPGDQFRSVIMGYLFYFLIVNTIDDWKKLTVLQWVMILCAMLIAVGAVVEVVTIPAAMRKERLGGLFQSITPAARYSFISIILCLWLLTASKASKVQRVILYISIPLSLATILIGGERTAMLNLGLSALALIWLLPKTTQALKFIVVSLLFLILAVQLILPLAPLAVQRAVSVLPGYAQIFDPDEKQMYVNTRGFSSRSLLISSGWHMFLDKPIFGVGFGNFRDLSVIYEPRLPGKLSGHNLIFTTLGETGLVGEILLLLMLGEIILSVWRARKYASGDNLYALTYNLLLIVGLGIIDANLHARYLERPAFVIFGMGVAVVRLVSEQRRREEAGESPAAREKIHHEARARLRNVRSSFKS
ncbi:MAG: hypothetical protein HFACDABA_02025 [Anaerolineales bacterium]|nr:hypothetical protein [Anaerolineales bacterium]